MALFTYAGLQKSGKKTSGTIDAPGKRSAQQQLKEMGIFVSSIEEISQSQKSSKPNSILQKLTERNVISSAELASATRQMGTLIAAGLPLDEVLKSVTQEETGPLAHIFETVREDIVQGKSLHQSLAEKKHFPDLYVNMVRVGESSGTLDQVLHRLADFLEEQEQLKAKVRSAMTYPLFMLIVGFAVLIFLMTTVVPKVANMLENMGQVLPLPTRILIGISHTITSYWWLMIIIALATWYAGSRYAQSEKGRWNIDRRTLQLPIIGPLQLQIATSRISRTLATLLSSGVHLLAALDIVSRLVTNKLLHAALIDAAAAVREGEGLTAPLQRSKLFPSLLTQMTGAGEKSGELEQMLGRVADTFDRKVETSINGMLSLLEPVMILLMGCIIGFIVASILLPIMDASQGMG